MVPAPKICSTGRLCVGGAINWVSYPRGRTLLYLGALRRWKMGLQRGGQALKMNAPSPLQYGLLMWASLLVVLGASDSHPSGLPGYTTNTDQKRGRIGRLPRREVQ